MARRAIPIIAFHGVESIYIYKNNKNIFKKMKENVGISKPKKHRNKIGIYIYMFVTCPTMRCTRS